MRLLLLAWWCTAVLPGLLVAIFLADDAELGAGWVVPIWIVGFIAQLFLFMAVSRNLKGVATSAIIWFTVSLLPFAIDWGIGLNWAAEIAFVLLAVVVALYIDYVLTRSTLLQANGVRATAVVLEVKKPLMNVVVNNIYIKRKLRVRVQRDDGVAPYETTYSDLWEIGGVPDPGDSFRVVLDPRRPQHLSALDERSSPAADVPTPVTGGRGSSGRSTWRFTSWRNPSPSKPSPPSPAPASSTSSTTYTPYSPAPSSPSTASGSPVRDVVAAIRQLAELHETGQLNDAEFAQAKAELLGGQDVGGQDSALPE